MFWLGLIISLLASLLSLGPFRRNIKAKFAKIHDDHLDSIRFIFVIIGLTISIVAYSKQIDRNRKLFLQINNTEALAQRANFRPISKDIFQELKNRLATISQKDRLDITLRIATGDYKREQLANEIIELFQSANINAKIGEPIFIIGPPRPPLEIIFVKGMIL